MNVRDFGAFGDGATDDTAALNEAIARAPAHGGHVYLPAGVYRTTAPIWLPSDRPVHLEGDGPEITVIASTGAGYHAISLDGSARAAFYVGMPAQITGLTVATTVDNPRAAINIEFYDLGFGSSVNEEMLLIRDVVVRPEESTAPVSFGVGLHLAGCWNAVLDNVVIHGDNRRAGMAAGIRLSKNSLDVNISNFRIMNAQVGIEINDRCEGTLIHHGWIISNGGVTDGIVASTRRGTVEEPDKPWLSVTATHLSVSRFGIFIVDHPQCAISGNLIYRWGSRFFRGIWLEGGGHSTILGNQVFNLGPAEDANGGIVLAAPSCTVSGNIVTGIPGIAIWLAAPATGCAVTGNVVGPGNIHNVGQGNAIMGNA